MTALSDMPGGPGRIWNYLQALVRSTGVSGRFAYGTQTDIHLADLWVIGHRLCTLVKTRDTLLTNTVTRVAVFSVSQAAIWRTSHLELRPEQSLARWIILNTKTLCEPGIEADIHWVLRHTGIPMNEKADHQENLAWERCQAGRVWYWVHTLAINRTR